MTTAQLEKLVANKLEVPVAEASMADLTATECAELLAEVQA
jgi:hypothetical protein